LEITIPNNWTPRENQRPIWNYMESGGLRGLLVAHRRYGKDDIALHYTATQMIEKPGNYWHMLPAYTQGKKVIWNAVNPKTQKRRIDEAFPVELRTRTNNTEMLIEMATGAVWQIVGSDNYDSIVGAPPRGIVFSEWALANPMAWPYLEPILEENGGWALFIYTSRGNNHGRTFYETALKSDHWFGGKVTAHETDVFTEEQLERIRQGLMDNYGDELGRALYEQEYECSFEGAVFGAYYAKQMRDAREQNRIGLVPYQPGIEVDTCWDLGIDDSQSCWFFQPIQKGFHFIDYYEASGYGWEHYAQVLKDKPYVYGNHWMPHDAAARVQSPGEVAKTPQEMAEDLGISPITTVERPRNMDLILKVQIPACRNMLARCWFDEEKCKHGIMCLENYKANYDEQKKKLGNRPEHDWASHGADAYRTFGVGYEEKKPAIKIRLPQYGQQAQGWMA
jgi:phage terminase large subunit